MAESSEDADAPKSREKGDGQSPDDESSKKSDNSADTDDDDSEKKDSKKDDDSDKDKDSKEGDKSDENDDSKKDGETEKESPLKKPWLRALLIVLAIVVVIGLVVWFVRYWTHGRFLQDTDDATIEADQQAVTNRVAGYVDNVYVADNQVVRRGDPLVRIDDGHPRAQIDQALGQVEQGLASIRQARAQIVQQRATIAQNQAQLAGSVVQAAFYARETERYAPLAASGAETNEKYDQMRQNRDQARATVSQNRAAVAAARRQILVLRAQAAQSLAQVHQAEAQVRSSRVDLDATIIRANLDGRVGNKTVTVGQYIGAGTRLMTVVPVESLYVVANFKETQLGIMRVGQPVTITVDALKQNDLHGWVESFSPGTGAKFALMPPNNATGNFTKIVQRVPTRIRLDAGPEVRRVLVPGLSVTVTVDTVGARDDVDRFKAEQKRDKPAGKRAAEDRNKQQRDIEKSAQ